MPILVNENMKSPLHNVFILSVFLLISTESRLCLAFPLPILKNTYFILFICMPDCGSKKMPEGGTRSFGVGVTNTQKPPDEGNEI